MTIYSNFAKTFYNTFLHKFNKVQTLKSNINMYDNWSCIALSSFINTKIIIKNACTYDNV